MLQPVSVHRGAMQPAHRHRLRRPWKERITVQSVAHALLLGCVLHQGAQAQQVPLYTWYSSARGDFFTTSAPEWRGTIGAVRGGQGDYVLVRIEGYVFDPKGPRPPDTRPLYHWWSEARKDNFLTTDPDWSGRAGDVRPGQGDYRLVRVEGYVFDRPFAGTIPLYSLWNSATQDNRATTDPLLWGRVPGTVTTAQGSYRRYRLEGHVLFADDGGDEPPADEATLRTRFGYGRLAPPRSSVPVLLMLNEWRDLSFPADAGANYRRLFAPSGPLGANDPIGLEQYSGFLSGGGFRFTMRGPGADVVGPFRDAITLAQANTILRTVGEDSLRKRAVSLLASNMDLRRFDREPDGTVSRDELIIMRVHPGSGGGGQQGSVTVNLGALTFAGSVLLLDGDAMHSLVMHELLHTYGATHHYGPARALNVRASVMAVSFGDSSTLQLDPYNRLQLGWTKLRLHALAGPTAQQVFHLTNMDRRPSHAGVILFDPARPREYFILQARESLHRADRGASLVPTTPALPSGTPARGLMIWHVVTNPNNSLRNIQRSTDMAGRVAWPSGTAANGLVEGALAVGADGRLGVPVLFTPGMTPITLRWFDGTSTGAVIQVTGVSENNVSVSLQPRDAAALPRLIMVPPLSRKATATLTGIMPLTDRGSWSVRLRRVEGTVPPRVREVLLPVEGWANAGVTVRVPAETATGRWEVRLEGPSGLSSNALSVEVVR